MRSFLDRLYTASGVLAALCLAGIAVVMLAQAAMRELGLLLRGADDMVAWLCAASAFLALGHTFRHGEMVRIGLLIERLAPPVRQRTEVITLGTALLVVAYIVYAAARFTYESWQFKELAQGLIQLPIWIPQSAFVAGALVLFIAVLDDFVALLRGARPAYRAAEEARKGSADFTETL
ncbi:MAG TPA: TRAP transporter small permease [Burkholderiales bacterium]|jgi:TRAP-type C4-dicarboxylate transport system permease small subunit|nr:TRAP transporter small permease [Burkholderiales bacterium]